MILHITTRGEWEAAGAAGAYVAPSLATEGFIHCSTPEQLVATANAYFRGPVDLVVLCIDEERVTAEVRWEAPTHSGGERAERFPHPYGPLDLDAVVDVLDLPVGEDGTLAAPAGLGRLMG
ncbi:MAG: DUF952 domain-containing protein [Dehalococcoidia bacterium]|nr:DUF952 domain-containing protein [Dehalococcoidia bacterium]